MKFYLILTSRNRNKITSAMKRGNQATILNNSVNQWLDHRTGVLGQDFKTEQIRNFGTKMTWI